MRFLRWSMPASIGSLSAERFLADGAMMAMWSDEDVEVRAVSVSETRSGR
jgi:hypothetical protein